jgi:hypothetical protein
MARRENRVHGYCSTGHELAISREGEEQREKERSTTDHYAPLIATASVMGQGESGRRLPEESNGGKEETETGSSWRDGCSAVRFGRVGLRGVPGWALGPSRLGRSARTRLAARAGVRSPRQRARERREREGERIEGEREHGGSGGWEYQPGARRATRVWGWLGP